MKYWYVIIAGFVVISLLALTAKVDGQSGSIDVPAGEYRTVSLGNLITGTLIDYSWITDDEYDTVDFTISDGTNEYHSQISVYGSYGTFEVPSEAEYMFYWYCDNWFDTANIDYSYTITLPEPDADIIVDYTFSENPCHQGNTTTCTVYITNDWDDQIRINEVWIHFDFFPEDVYDTQQNLGDIIASDQVESYEFEIEVNTDVTLGLHKYDVIIYYEGRLSGNWVEDTWESGNQLDFFVIEIDRDFDGHPDSTDTFPDNPNEWKDSDSDGVGDNSDAFPNDASETVDSDEDGVGDNGDAFPNDPSETKDTDEDGVGDNADAFPNDPDETEDTDSDGVGDNGDAFPNDIAASVDTDGDGYPDAWNLGKSEDNSTSGLKLDHYPEDPDKWKKPDDSSGWFLMMGIITLLGCSIIYYRRRM